MLHSSRLGIAYPDPTSETDLVDVPRDIASLVAWLDVAGLIYTGLLVNRPPSSGGSPGVIGRWYWATDGGGSLSFDTGTGWLPIYPHAANHAVGGSDPVTPSSIGAVGLSMLIALG